MSVTMNRIVRTAIAALIVTALVVESAPIVRAVPTAGLDSSEFAFRYEMDVLLGTQDLDSAGTGDWFNGTSGGLTQPSVAGGLGISNQAAGTPQILWRTDFSNSLSRATVNGNFTLEASVQLVGGDQDAGDVGGFGFALQQPGQANSLRFNVNETQVSFNGAGTGAIATSSNTDALHTYRIAYEAPNNYWVWRDGVLLNANLATPITGSNGSFTTGMAGGWFLGDFTGSLSGNWTADYIRVTPGSFAPAAASTFGDAQIQLGFDFTSGTVASQNNGVIEDDSPAPNTPFRAFRDAPSYNPSIPSADRLQFTSGIGSIDVSDNGGNATVASIANIGASGITESAITAAGGITMEIWVDPTAIGTGGTTIMGIGDAFVLESRVDQFVLLTNSSGNPTPTFAMTEADKVAAGWLHLAGVFYVGPGAADNVSSLYLNGELVAQETGLTFVPVFDAVANRFITLGNGSNFDNRDFQGLLFEPRITLGVLDPTEFTTTDALIPEPVTAALVLPAAGALLLRRRRRA